VDRERERERERERGEGGRPGSGGGEGETSELTFSPPPPKSLRFKATNLQYELLKLDRSIEKHESLQRIQMLEQAKKMRNLAFMAAGMKKEAGKAES